MGRSLPAVYGEAQVKNILEATGNSSLLVGLKVTPLRLDMYFISNNGGIASSRRSS